LSSNPANQGWKATLEVEVTLKFLPRAALALLSANFVFGSCEM
jgi:hypothetical protein